MEWYINQLGYIKFATCLRGASAKARRHPAELSSAGFLAKEFVGFLRFRPTRFCEERSETERRSNLYIPVSI